MKKATARKRTSATKKSPPNTPPRKWPHVDAPASLLVASGYANRPERQAMCRTISIVLLLTTYASSLLHAAALDRTKPKKPQDLTPQMAFFPGLLKQWELPERNALRNNALFLKSCKRLTPTTLARSSPVRSPPIRKVPSTN